MVDSAVVARGGLIKKRSIEKPRPLRSDPDQICLSEILRLCEEVECGLTSARNDLRTRKKTQQLKELLRLNGQAMERVHKDCLDRLEVTMREACKDSTMDIVTRLNILETIDLRLQNWTVNPVMSTMYRQKLAEAQLDLDLKKIGYEGGGETKSQEGNGNDVSVNNTNNNSSNINNNNPTPAGDSFKLLLQNAVQDDLKFCTSLVVNGHRIQISSTSDQIVNTSKEVLQEFFSILEDSNEPGIILSKPDISYEKEELLRLSKSPLCKDAPRDWEKIVSEIPYIAKKEGAPSKHFLREMEVIKKQEAARKM